MWNGIYSRKSSVIKRSIAGETLLVPASGTPADMQKIFVLDTVAGHIWDRLDGNKTLDEIHSELMELFEVTSEQLKSDMAEFVAELNKAGLIESANGQPK